MMIGHGARMIYQGLFIKELAYKPVLFDIFFDWFTLLVFGLILLYYSLKTFYHKFEKQNDNESKDIQGINSNPS